MARLKLAGNFIAAFDNSISNSLGFKGYSHLQIVYDSGFGSLVEAEVQAEKPATLGNWGYAPFGRDHATNTAYINSNESIQNPNRYKSTDLDLRPGQTAEHVWQLIGQVHQSLQNQPFRLDYDIDQNSNSYVNSVLSVVGIELAGISSSRYTGADMRSFPGQNKNVFDTEARVSLDGATGPFPAAVLRKVTLDIAGTSGNDYIDGGIGNDQLYGGNAGRDTIYGGGGDDRISGRSDIDRLYGESGNDTIWGGSGNDTVYGGNDNDRLMGGSDNDFLWGQNGNDYMWGQIGNDKLAGGSGNDVMSGGDGNDTIWGQNGNDRLYGNNGNDKLLAGAGRDQMTGGEGQDQFIFYSSYQSNGSRAQINDFDSGWDKILFQSGFKRFDGVTIANGQAADTNNDGRITTQDVGWDNWGSDGLIFYGANNSSIVIDIVDLNHQLSVFDIA